MKEQLLTKRQIDYHFRSFPYCHSAVRAEKDLIVYQVLDVIDQYTAPVASFAKDGGTSLAKYQAAISRFSEGVDLRVLFDEKSYQESPHELMHGVGNRLRSHLQSELAYLKPTKKGRLRWDGVINTLIFDFIGNEEHSEVTPGNKVELVAIPLRQRLAHAVRKLRDCPIVAPLEVISGKFVALTERLPSAGDSNPDLVRHEHDIASSTAIIDSQSELLESLVGSTRSLLPLIIEELCRPIWRTHYYSSMERMGSFPTVQFDLEDIPRSHMAWLNVLTQFTLICRRMNAVDDEIVSKVQATVDQLLQEERSRSSE